MRVNVEGGKYSIVIGEDGTDVHLLRHGEMWVRDPLYSKMLIAIAYELDALYKEVEELRQYKRASELSSERT